MEALECGRRHSGARELSLFREHRQEDGTVSPEQMREWIRATFGGDAPPEREPNRPHYRVDAPSKRGGK